MLCATCQTQVANCLAVTLPTLPQEGLQLLRKAFAVSDRSWPRCSGDSPTCGLFQQLSGKKFSELFDQPELRHRAILGWIVQGLKICFFLCSFSPSLTENSSTAQFWHSGLGIPNDPPIPFQGMPFQQSSGWSFRKNFAGHAIVDHNLAIDGDIQWCIYIIFEHIWTLQAEEMDHPQDLQLKQLREAFGRARLGAIGAVQSMGST